MDRYDVNYKLIFNKQLVQWIDQLSAVKGEDASRRTIEWLNSKGYFIPYAMLEDPAVEA